MESLIPLVMLAGFIYLGYRILKSKSGGGPRMVCKTCGHVGETTIHTKGSIGIELVLWLFFIIPGLIYSIWRHSTRGPACASCGGSDLIPANSPMGRKVIKEFAE